ncbi:tRNA (guanosine(37)-N1)-methyltransferase TrmD [Candidatus Woesebacteria bacterium]|nr:tRNA (guanosine(37)-N1)-methyltransferase TrmD [Candidatus Woesebacteria bacterium]
MKVNLLTIFPDYFVSSFNASIIKRGQKFGAVEINIIDIRNFAQDKHKLTDDRPFGGGPGMVMKVEPIDLALKSIGVTKQTTAKNSKIMLTSAKGKLFNQKKAIEYSNLDELTIICGHYEGVDERVAENLVDEEIRIGDYVLTGGEPAALVIIDSIVRLLPSVLGNDESNKNESHSVPGKLSHPQYTRPQEYNGWKVPDVLITGNHENVAKWRSEKTGLDK